MSTCDSQSCQPCQPKSSAKNFRGLPTYNLKSAFEEPMGQHSGGLRRSMKPRNCDGKICGPYDTRLCPQEGNSNQAYLQQGYGNPAYSQPRYGGQPYSQLGYNGQAYSQQGYSNQISNLNDFDQDEEEDAMNLPSTKKEWSTANASGSVCDVNDRPNYWQGLYRKQGNSTIDELRKNVWCGTPMTEYMATHGDLATKMLTGQVSLKRDVLGEPPCNVCEYVMPPCRGYCQEPECIDYSKDMSCTGMMPNRDRVSRYWNPCLISNCDNSTLAFPASGLIEKLRKRNA